jgi:LPPG:FO 2-phospho-L-lactate transferase
MILVFAGGVGGAKLASGLSRILPPEDLAIAVNTGDDFTHLGLHISPDIDTVTYKLAGVSHPINGWGRAGDSFRAMGALEALGAPTWFNLGDLDLATHIERTRRLAEGETLSEVTAAFASKLGIKHPIIPMSDDAVRTMIKSGAEWLAFQDYFVRLRCEPAVSAITFQGSDAAAVSPQLERILSNHLVEALVIAPSNPFVSVDPILSIKRIRDEMVRRKFKVVAVSPIVAGRALKGPALKMMQELGIEATVVGIAKHYQRFVDGIVIDTGDIALKSLIESLGMRVFVTDIVMRNASDEEAVARNAVKFARDLQDSSRL